jgi:hypothetical protein
VDEAEFSKWLDDPKGDFAIDSAFGTLSDLLETSGQKP